MILSEVFPKESDIAACAWACGLACGLTRRRNYSIWEVGAIYCIVNNLNPGRGVNSAKTSYVQYCYYCWSTKANDLDGDILDNARLDLTYYMRYSDVTGITVSFCLVSHARWSS